jgi:hypothetical protein
MNTMDADTVGLLTGSLRELFAQLGPEADLQAALAELGWAEVSAAEPARATGLLFAEQGRALAASRALDAVVLAELGQDDSPAVVYPLPNEGTQPRRWTGEFDGVVLGLPAAVTRLVVPCGTDAGVGLVEASVQSVTAEAANVFDRSSPWLRVRGRVAARPRPLADRAWAQAVAAGQRAVAAELGGVCEAALALAVEHVTTRHQYGRPIGTFQAVRHRVAEAYVGVESARDALELAVATLDPATATLAKIRAGRAQAVLMRHLIQFFGAMGLALESPVHPYVTRAAVLDALLGGHAGLTEQLGADLLSGAEPAVVVEI